MRDTCYNVHNHVQPVRSFNRNITRCKHNESPGLRLNLVRILNAKEHFKSSKEGYRNGC